MVEFDAGHRLLVAEQQRLVAGEEIGASAAAASFSALMPQARMKPSVSVIRSRELLVAVALRAVLDEAQHPAVHVLEVGIAALREGAQQVQRRRRLAVGLELALRIGHARLGA